MKNELEKLLDKDIEIFKESDLTPSGRQIWQICVIEHDGWDIYYEFQYDTEANRDEDYNNALEYLNEYYGDTCSKGA